MKFATIFLLLAACTEPDPTPPSTAVPITIPTPPASGSADAPLLPILLPNEANKWITYHDGLFDFGLALPQQWRIFPPDPHATQPTLTIANYNTALTNDDCAWPDNLAQLAFTGWELDPAQSTLDWIGIHIEVQSLEAAANGRYAGYLLTTNQQQELILRLTPDLILQIQVTPATAWQLPDVQGILNSLAAAKETINLPTTRPTSPVAMPGFCRDVAPLYSGPGEHFEQVGLLSAYESSTVIGRSHDGRWIKLLYPSATNGIAWASLSETVITAGEPPIEAIQIQPGNG
jgi:hypothetical protein